MNDIVTDFYTTLDGKRTFSLDGHLHSDFVPMNALLDGERQSPAIKYLISQGFSWEDAQEYLDSLPELKDGKYIFPELQDDDFFLDEE